MTQEKVDAKSKGDVLELLSCNVHHHLHQPTFFSGRYFTFHNYTLQKSSDKHIILLHLNLGNPAASLPKINYENLCRGRPNREEVSNDFATLVSSVQQNRIFAKKVKTYFSDIQDLPC